MPKIRWFLILPVLAALSACTPVSVAGAAVSTTASVAGTAVSTTTDVATGLVDMALQ